MMKQLPIVAIVCSLVTVCYTTEFRPSDQYEALHREHSESIEVSFLPPNGSYVFLGDLVFADIPNAHDSGFLDYVKTQARRRGASYAYVDLARTQIKRGVDYVPLPVPYYGGNMSVKTAYKTVFVALYSR